MADTTGEKGQTVLGAVHDRLAFNEAAYGKAWTGEMMDTQFILAPALEEIERLREALAIYATRTNWTCARGYEPPRIHEHEWRTAAAALERTTEEAP